MFVRTVCVARLVPLVLIITACTFARAETVALELLASGFDRPVQVVSAHDGSGALYVAQQNGIVIRIAADGSRSTFLDLSQVVSCCDNGGLLSVVFHPQFGSNRRLFVQYVNRDGDTAIARVQAPNDLDVLLTIDQPKDEVPNHHGGTLQFGPDGYLYASVGDGGAYVRVTNRAQQLELLLGKLLRIDVDHASGYSVPFDNPYAGLPGTRPEIWSSGLRNPWRFSFDRVTGELLLADVGQDSWEEVDILTLAAARAANFGWPIAEGSHCYPPGSPCSTNGLVMPQLEYSHAQGCSITGGYRYRGRAWPQWTGTYFYGDLCSGKLWIASRSASTLQETGKMIVSFGEDDDGELYLVDYRGAVYRMKPAPLRRRAAPR